MTSAIDLFLKKKKEKKTILTAFAEAAMQK